MAIFEYQALTSGNRLMKGSVEAASASMAQQMLEEMHLTVESLELAAAPMASTKIGRGELLLFNQQLASITRANIPLDQGLRQIASEIDKPAMRKLVTQLADDLSAGVGVEEAFERRRQFFPPLYGHIVKAGIASGRLGEMLTSLNRHLEMQGQTRRIIFEAITYPLVVLTLAAILLTAIFLTVIPAFVPIYDDMGIHLPGITLLILYLAQNVVPFWLAVGGIVAALAVLVLSLNSTAGGRVFKEAIYFHIPVLGRLYQRSLMSRLSDCLALLVGAGTGMPDAFRLATAATGNQTFMNEGNRLAGLLERGENLTDAGALCHQIPPLFFYSMQAGSQRNELQDNLYNLCEMYTQQARSNQARLQGLLLPLMIIFVGGILAVSITAMFLPMVALMQAISG
jgi:type IV pilus assembly protein PilC